jgi:uncharacterized RDD family membrane protein YckC
VHPDEQVVTGEAVALELRLAGAGSRGIAALIDLFIATAVQLIALIPILLLSWGSDAAVLTLLIVTVVGITLGYPVAMETLWRGRTLGKAWMGLRVVRDDGGPIRFRHALVRGLVGVVLEKPGLTYGLLALISMVASSRKKRLGDFAAGTIVLQDRVPGHLEAPVFMPPALAGWAVGLDLAAVDDGLALRMRQFLGRASQLAPAARASLEHQLASDLVARVGPAPPDTPGSAIITAVLAERRRRAFDAKQRAQAPTPWATADAPATTWPPPLTSRTDGAGTITDKPATTMSESESAPPPPSTTGFAPPG